MAVIKIPKRARTILSDDPVLRRLIDAYPLHFPPSRGSVYEDLLEAIVYQQISIKAAGTIFNRFCELFGDKIPTPAELIDADHQALRAAGLSGQKASYVQNIARHFSDHQWTNADFLETPDDEITGMLTEIKGVGEWTAQMILIFSLARPDVFPVKDYGVQTAMIELYEISDPPGKAMLERCRKHAEKWRPFRTFGTLLMWSWKRKQMGY